MVRLETRPPSLEGRGEITQRDLVRNALRMRPDRIIIGEVRGSRGVRHAAGDEHRPRRLMSTIHANTTRDALTRIENMVQMGNMGLPAARDPHADRRRRRPDRAGGTPSRRRPPGHPGDRRLRPGRRYRHPERHLPVQVDGETWRGGLVGRYKINRAAAELPPAAVVFRPRPRLGGGAGRSRAMSPTADTADGRGLRAGGVGDRRLLDSARSRSARRQFRERMARLTRRLRAGQSADGAGTQHRRPVRAGGHD